jgi:hypothetical protein
MPLGLGDGTGSSRNFTQKQIYIPHQLDIIVVIPVVIFTAMGSSIFDIYS